MLDLEVRHPSHNFLLSSGLITSNSHAVAYSAVSTAELWLKHHYFVEFMTALINNTKLGKKKHGSDNIMVDYVNYARRHGVEVHGPDVSRSMDRFSIEKGAIRFSLGHVKNVARSAPVIMAAQPFTSVEDFYERVYVEVTLKKGGTRQQRVNKKVVESLIMAGAFDEFGTRNEVAEEYHRLRKKSKEEPLQLSDDGWAAKEVEVIGLCLSREPLVIEHADLIRSKRWCPIGDEGRSDNVSVFGRLEHVQAKVSKNGNPMLVCTLADGIDKMDFYVWERDREKFNGEVSMGDVVVVPMRRFDDGGARFYHSNKKCIVVRKRGGMVVHENMTEETETC